MNTIVATPVSLDELVAALNVFSALPPEDRRDWEARGIALIEHFHQPGNSPADDAAIANKVLAIEFRLEALSRLRERPEFARWTLSADDEHGEFLHNALLEAVATEPLVAGDRNRPGFDPDAFFARVLRSAEAKGSA